MRVSVFVLVHVENIDWFAFYLESICLFPHKSEKDYHFCFIYTIKCMMVLIYTEYVRIMFRWSIKEMCLMSLITRKPDLFVCRSSVLEALSAHLFLLHRQYNILFLV